MWKNLFPQGTRTVELCSAYGLLLLSVISLLQGFILPELTAIEPKLEWTLLLSIFGFLQLFSLFYYPKVELLRVLASWFAGCFWLWVGAISSKHFISAEDIAAIVLGVGNLYGFILNFNLLKVSWKP